MNEAIGHEQTAENHGSGNGESEGPEINLIVLSGGLNKVGGISRGRKVQEQQNGW